MPDLSDKLYQLDQYLGNEEFNQRLHEIWPTIQPQTIDYGIMEHAENVAVIPAREMGWSDIGSWDSLFDFLPIDEKGNVIRSPDISVIDSHNVLVYSETREKFVAVIGVDDLIIVESENGLLICKKGQSEHVKAIVSDIKDKKLNKYL
jgi:mannose-1-phosphate guanylyltransferase